MPQKMALFASNGIHMCQISSIMPRGNLNLEIPPKSIHSTHLMFHLWSSLEVDNREIKNVALHGKDDCKLVPVCFTHGLWSQYDRG